MQLAVGAEAADVDGNVAAGLGPQTAVESADRLAGHVGHAARH